MRARGVWQKGLEDLGVLYVAQLHQLGDEALEQVASACNKHTAYVQYAISREKHNRSLS